MRRSSGWRRRRGGFLEVVDDKENMGCIACLYETKMCLFVFFCRSDGCAKSRRALCNFPPFLRQTSRDIPFPFRHDRVCHIFLLL